MAIVPTTDNVYTGNGTTTQFAIGFDYLNAGDVAVSVDEVLVSFTFATSGIVNVTPAPANGARVRVFRNTDATVVPYVFTDGVPFLTRYSDFNWKTLLYAFQEAWAEFKNNAANYLRTLRATTPINPIPDNRANKLLGFGADGQPLAVEPSASSVPALDIRLSNVEAAYLDAADIADRLQVIPNIAALSTFTPVAGRVYYLNDAPLGAGSVVAKSGSVTPDNVSTFASGTVGLYFERLREYNYKDYYRKPTDLSGLIQTNGKRVVITGDSLSYNNYGFGFPFAATAQEANAGIRSWGFLLRDAIHMSDPCFVYGDNIPWHINNPTYAAVAINNTNPFVLPFNNRSLRCVVGNSAAEVTFTINSFNILNKQIVLHIAHSPGQPGKFDVYYNDNSGGSDVFVQNVEVGNGVDHQGYEPFTIAIPVNTLDSCARVIFKNFTDENDDPVVTPLAFFVLAAGSKLTNVYTTGVGGTTSEYTNTNYASLIGTYDPDLLILCTGANDRVSFGIDRHIAALDSIITKARTTNPAVRIIHITTPPAVGVDNPGFYPESATGFGSTMKQWIAAVERLCAFRDVEFFNQYRFFYDIDSSYLFVDGIHLTRNAGRDVFKALVANYFSSCGAPIEQLNGYSTYSTKGTGDLMGRQIGRFEETKATVKLSGQFKMTYVHSSTNWLLSDNHEYGTNKPSAFKGFLIDGAVHTTDISFFVPCVSTAYNECSFPLSATAEFVGGAVVAITGLTLKPKSNNVLTLSIRDSTGALIDPATMDGAQFIIKYRM